MGRGGGLVGGLARCGCEEICRGYLYAGHAKRRQKVRSSNQHKRACKHRGQ